MDGTRGPQGLCSPCQQGPLLPRKNASAILSGSHPPYIMPPSLHYNKRINLPRICKAIGPGRGRGGVVGGQGDVVELSFPFSVHHVCFSLLQSRATNHQHPSWGWRGRRWWQLRHSGTRSKSAAITEALQSTYVVACAPSEPRGGILPLWPTFCCFAVQTEQLHDSLFFFFLKVHCVRFASVQCLENAIGTTI